MGMFTKTKKGASFSEMKQLVGALMGIIFTKTKKRKLFSRGKEKKHDFMDRLSELPEDVIHHIMSFLPSTTDTTRIGVLSKRLNSVWRSFPTLVFDQVLYEKARSSSKSKGLENKLETFLNSVEDSLRRRDGAMKIEKLTLRGRPGDARVWPDGKSDWLLNFAIQSNVKQLKLDYATFHHIPEGLYSAKLITSLDFKDIWLKPKRLFTLTCPCLEKLSLDKCYGITGVTLQCPKLKTVKLLQCAFLTELHIDTDSDLEYLLYQGRDEEYYPYSLMEKMSCKSLIKIAELSDALCMNDNWLGLLRCVEKLKLQRCDVFSQTGQTWSLEHLTTLELVGFVSVEAQLEAPNLRLLEYKTDMHRKFDLNLSSSNTMLHVKLDYGRVIPRYSLVNYHVVPHYHYPKGLNFYVHLKDFTTKPSSRACHTLSLVCDSDNDLIIPEYERDTPSSLLCAIKDLKIVLKHRIQSPVDKMVDSLLWLVPRPDSISIHTPCNAVKSIKFTYHWGDHNLKQVKLDNFEGGNAKEIILLENYFTYRFGLALGDIIV